MPIRFNGPKPPRPGPKIKVVRVTTVTPQMFILLTPDPLTVWTHFGRRSDECTMEERGECEGCAKAQPRRWKGYFDAINYTDRERVILELTPPAIGTIAALCTERENARGLIVEISKTKGGKHGRYIVRTTNTTIDVATLAEPVDPLPTLRILWAWGKDDGQ